MNLTWHEQLGQLYREHRRGLFALALSVTRTQDAAEDAVQEAFTRLCRAAGSPKGVQQESQLVAYAYRSVKNAAVDQWRRQKTQTTIKDGLAQQPPLFDRGSATPLGDAQAAEEQTQLMEAIEQLPETDQQTVLLKVYGGLSVDQIANALEQSRTTVSSRYHRALKKLKTILTEQAGAEVGAGYA